LSWEETAEVAAGLVQGPPTFGAASTTPEIAAALASGDLSVNGANGTALNVSSETLETLRRFTHQADTATSGLVALLELARRIGQRSDHGWAQASHLASAWQPSVAAVIAGLRTHLEEEPTIAETMWWLVSRFVLPVHERVAYSKLPEFTFRFRWEEGLLRFYDQGIGRFPLAAIRNDPLSSITWDLGLWTTRDGGQLGYLTAEGRVFVNEVFP
jgi:hypothetical protein